MFYINLIKNVILSVFFFVLFLSIANAAPVIDLKDPFSKSSMEASVILTWGTPVDVDYNQVIIYRDTKALTTPQGTPLATLKGTISTYTDETAEPSTTYVYTP